MIALERAGMRHRVLTGVLDHAQNLKCRAKYIWENLSTFSKLQQICEPSMCRSNCKVNRTFVSMTGILSHNGLFKVH